jgi:Leucine-rich repeat (LRR) protein
MDKLKTLDGIEFYQGMEVLKLGDLNGLKDASALKKCPNLKYIENEGYELDLPSCQSMDGLIGPQCKKLQIRLAGWGAPVFPAAAELEELDIECRGMQDLEWLASFPGLKNLSIQCESLRDTRGLRFTPLLETLVIEDSEISHLDLPESLDRLRCIRLSNCNQLKSLEEVKFLTAIEQVTVTYCESLETIQDITDNERLRDNGSLHIQGLPSLKVLGNSSFIETLQRVKITGTFHAGLLKQLAAAPNLVEVYFEKGFLDDEMILETDEEWKAAIIISKYKIVSIQAPGIRRLTLELCHFTDFNSNINLSGIRELCLNECSTLESLAGLEHSKDIERLSIVKCNKLMGIESLQALAQLEYLALDGLGSLKRISSIAYLANLTTLAIDHCPVMEVSPRRKVQSDREDILKFRLSLSEHYQTGLQEVLTQQLGEAKKSRSATVPNKDARHIRKGLRERDVKSIRKAVSRLDALQDATLLDALLDGIALQENKIVPSPFFKGTAPAQIYLNTAMMGVLGVASKQIPRWKQFTEGVSILHMQLSSIEYAGCFRNLLELNINSLEAFPSPIDLPKLEFLKIECNSSSGTVSQEERMRLEYLSPCRNLKSITIQGVLDSLETLDFMQEFKGLEMLSIQDIRTFSLRDLAVLGRCTRLKKLELAVRRVWAGNASQASVPEHFLLDGIERCTELESLTFSDIPLMDTQGIRGLKNIRDIELKRLPIHHLTMPEEAPVLENIIIEGCKNLSSVALGTSSENIFIQCSGTSLEEFPIPRTAANLTIWNIRGNHQLASLDGFRHVKTVREEWDFSQSRGNKITLEDSRQIKDINGVSHIPDLILELDVPMLPQNIVPNLIIGLRLSGIRSLEGIGQFPKLTRLTIANDSEGFSLEAMQELKSLQTLELEGNEQLLSLKGIAHLRHLKLLNLKNTPNLADISDLEHVMVDAIFIRGSKMKKADFPEHLRQNVVWN